MPTDLLSTFTDSLTAHDVTWTVTSPTDAQAELSSLVTEPAVAAPLETTTTSLPQHCVTSPSPRELDTAQTGITEARYGIADYGTLVIPSHPGGDEPVSLFPPTHLAILSSTNLLPDVPTTLSRLSEDYNHGLDSVVFATGPSATADMGALVQGVHGPETVHVLIITNQ